MSRGKIKGGCVTVGPTTNGDYTLKQEIKSIFVIYKKETKFKYEENNKFPFVEKNVIKIVDSEEKALAYLKNPNKNESDVEDLTEKSEPYYCYQEFIIE